MTRPSSGPNLVGNAIPKLGRCILPWSTRTLTPLRTRCESHSRLVCAFLTLVLDCIPSRHPPAAFLLARVVNIPCLASSIQLTGSHRHGYMSYGSFGQVAAHELTVRDSEDFVGYHIDTPYRYSMRSILLVGCTINKVNLSNGGPTQPAKASTRCKRVLLNSILVCARQI